MPLARAATVQQQHRGARADLGQVNASPGDFDKPRRRRVSPGWSMDGAITVISFVRDETLFADNEQSVQ
jgi:hypothetical protein